MRHRWIPAALALFLAAPAVSLADSDSHLRLRIDGEDGGQINLDLSSSWLSSLLAAADITCDGSDDRQTRRMARELSRRGEGGVYEYRDHDGDRIVARRSRGQLILETRHRDGDRGVVELPWVLAECTMLGREPEGGLGRYLQREGLSLRIDARDGDGRVRLTFD